MVYVRVSLAVDSVWQSSGTLLLLRVFGFVRCVVGEYGGELSRLPALSAFIHLHNPRIHYSCTRAIPSTTIKSTCHQSLGTVMQSCAVTFRHFLASSHADEVETFDTHVPRERDCYIRKRDLLHTRHRKQETRHRKQEGGVKGGVTVFRQTTADGQR